MRNAKKKEYICCKKTALQFLQSHFYIISPFFYYNRRSVGTGDNHIVADFHEIEVNADYGVYAFLIQFTISWSRALSFVCSIFQAIRLEPTPKRSLKEAPNSEKNPVPRTICPLITLRYLTILYSSKSNPDVVKNVSFSSGRLATILLRFFRASSNSFCAASAASFSFFSLSANIAASF